MTGPDLDMLRERFRGRVAIYVLGSRQAKLLLVRESDGASCYVTHENVEPIAKALADTAEPGDVEVRERWAFWDEYEALESDAIDREFAEEARRQ